MLGALLGLAVALVLVLEGAFRVGGLWVAGAPRPDEAGNTVILCVGDSHTRGRAGLENYPAQLERILNERTTRRYRVINLGVPGQNTAEVRARFAHYLDYYRPAIVLHWAGINNFWNRAEREGPAPGLLTRIADASRVVRFVRVALLYRRLHVDAIAEPIPQEHSVPGPQKDFWVDFGGVKELIRSEPGTDLSVAETHDVTRDDLQGMMQLARQRGIPMYLVTYAWWGGYFKAVNQAIEEVSSEFGVPYVDEAVAARAAAQEAPGAQLYDAWIHPMPIVYRQVAEEAYRTLVSQLLVAPLGS